MLYFLTCLASAFQPASTIQWLPASRPTKRNKHSLGSHQVLQQWNDGTKAPWCISVLIVMHVSKFFQTHLNSWKTYHIRVHKTGFHKFISPLVGCYYDLVPGRYQVPDNRPGERREGDLHYNFNRKSLASPRSSWWSTVWSFCPVKVHRILVLCPVELKWWHHHERNHHHWYRWSQVPASCGHFASMNNLI